MINDHRAIAFSCSRRVVGDLTAKSTKLASNDFAKAVVIRKSAGAYVIRCDFEEMSWVRPSLSPIQHWCELKIRQDLKPSL